jgi:hypothetical protein
VGFDGAASTVRGVGQFDFVQVGLPFVPTQCSIIAFATRLHA